MPCKADHSDLGLSFFATMHNKSIMIIVIIRLAASMLTSCESKGLHHRVSSPSQRDDSGNTSIANRLSPPARDWRAHAVRSCRRALYAWIVPFVCVSVDRGRLRGMQPLANPACVMWGLRLLYKSPYEGGRLLLWCELDTRLGCWSSSLLDPSQSRVSRSPGTLEAVASPSPVRVSTCLEPGSSVSQDRSRHHACRRCTEHAIFLLT